MNELTVNVEYITEIEVKIEEVGIAPPLVISDPHLTQWVEYWLNTGE